MLRRARLQGHHHARPRRRVGITEAALYRYYPSKEAMYAAILDERMAAVDCWSTRSSPIARAGDDRAVFTSSRARSSARVEADPDLLRILLFSALEGHELARPFQENASGALREFLTQYIERRYREGAFRAVDPALARAPSWAWSSIT